MFEPQTQVLERGSELLQVFTTMNFQECTSSMPPSILQGLPSVHSEPGSWMHRSKHRGDLPNPGIEPVSPALASRFFTTVLPERPFRVLYITLSKPRSSDKT
ncbi:hypothetical protein CapIbe_013595 [Capra ibex]